MFSAKDIFQTKAKAGGYTISKSLRFRSSASANLTRTPSSTGSRTTFIWSGWVKIGSLSQTASRIFDAGSGSIESGLVYNKAGTTNLLQFEYYNGSSYTTQCITTAAFRDPSAWYHIIVAVDSTQSTSSNRVFIIVNGVGQALSTATYPSLNATYAQNTSGTQNTICRFSNTAQSYFDGYITELNFIDGYPTGVASGTWTAANIAAVFGQTDTATGVWMPKAYTGTYGTNGFYLNFSDASGSTATTIGKDSSGNGNNWTPNNISVTAGVTYDSMVDTPTNYDNGGNGAGNYATFNPLLDWHTNGSNFTFSNGNLDISEPATTTYGSVASTIAMTTGKWYFEATATAVGAAQNTFAGITSTTSAAGYPGQTASSYSYGATGNKFNNNTSSAYGATFAANDIIGVAFDADNGKIWFSKNGTWQASGDPVAGTNAAFTGIAAGSYFFVVGDFATTQSSAFSGNFGQRAFNSTPPTGFKALCTQNLPTPTIGATSSTLANKYFDIVTRSGTGASVAISSLQFSPDFVWIKSRSNAYYHKLFDRLRTANKPLASNATDAETTETQGLMSFDANGYTLGTSSDSTVNNSGSGQTYVDWSWKANGSGSSNTSGTITSTVSANVTAGFSVVTYTGTSTTGTVGHGLGVAPKMIIVKTRNAVADWYVYHASNGANKYMYMNLTNAVVSAAGYFDTVSSTVFGGTSAAGIISTSNFVAYCFAEVAGYSKFGSYTGNGSADGPFVYCGFRPKYLLIKVTNGVSDWIIIDTSRLAYNVDDAGLYPNASSAEVTGQNGIDILSNGFKCRSANSSTNAGSAYTYIFAAFAESPFNYARAR